MRMGRSGMLAAVVLLLSLTPSEGPTCGPYFVRAVFAYESFPASEIEPLADGEVGVIYPTWWRRFLFAAYRHMTDQPLTAAEKKVLRSEWRPEEVDGYARWMEVRGRVPGVGDGPSIGMLRRVPGDDWQHFVNCNENSFLTAAETLDSRIEQFGANHPGIRQWVEAQDTVLSNCESGEAIPEEPPADLPGLLHKDRTYQIAAAKFYALQLHEAQVEFAAIANDGESPWRDIAPYLAARCVIRRATLDPRPGHVDLDLLSRAAHELRQILADNSRTAIHSATRRMLEFVNGRLEPGRRLAEVARALSRPSETEEAFHRGLIDFQLLMDRGAGRKRGARESDLVDWVVTFQDTSEASLAHALSRWRESAATVWLVAAITKVSGSYPDSRALVEAAAAIQAGSAAWPTAVYHRVRLLIETGHGDEARELLDRILPDAGRHSPASAVNLFRQQRLSLARDLDEFLEFAPRRAIAYGPSSMETWAASPDEDDPETVLAGDATAVFNRGLPLAVLEGAASSERLPAVVRRDVAAMTWVRAVLLSDWERARRLSVSLPDGAAQVEDRFSAAYYLLRNPGLRPYLVSGTLMRRNTGEIDSLRDNWWCAFDSGGPLDAWPYRQAMDSKLAHDQAPPPEPQLPDFLDAAQLEQFSHEWSRLLSLDTAPNWLAGIVVEHAREHPDDPRLPEALHLAVRSTRYGCTNNDTGSASQSAFSLLHRRYPDSEWAKKTPYWFQ